MEKSNGVESILSNKKYKEYINDNDLKDNKTDILDFVKNIDDISNLDSNVALVLMMEKMINNFELKDIISRGKAKDYAILSATNKIQRDIINEIISKQNDNKGQTKIMYRDFINNTIKSIRSNQQINENQGFLSRFRKG